MILKAIVDVQVEIEALAGNAIELMRLEVLDFDESLEGAVAVDARRFGPQGFVEDEADAADVHGSVSGFSATELGALRQ